ncbi:hypothetical protein KAK07_09040 [Ideonella sp. 4Y16]|uniref:hypothetical protein n=1 Tax=Ideonella alba TaxID=2824118 RepID=UPI001B3774DC|nr:hypothetical protein [Ideonella alba]MBQ0943480.1 hypothetical protein [Ideonella alba]
MNIRTAGVVVCLVCVALAGCAVAAAPPETPSVPRAADTSVQDRALLERLLAQIELRRLVETLAVRDALVNGLAKVSGEVDRRMAAGVAPRVQLLETQAELADARISRQQLVSALEQRQADYLQRYGEAADLSGPFSLFGPMPGLDQVRQRAGSRADEAEDAWQALRRLEPLMPMYQSRANALTQLVTIRQSQFDIGQVSVSEYSVLLGRLAAAQAQAVTAEAQRRIGWARLQAAIGRLQPADLAPRVAAFAAAAASSPPITSASAVQHVPAPGPTPAPPRSPDADNLEAPAAGAPSTDPTRPADTSTATCGDGRSTGGLPPMDWPPPRPTSETEISRQALLVEGAPTTLGDVGRRLQGALDKLNYTNAYLSVPNGFALVSRIERILEDGRPSPGPGRWSQDPPRNRELSFGAFVQSLFRAPVGRYRVIVFVVTDAPRNRQVPQTAETERRLQDLLDCGSTQLPVEVARLPFSARVRAQALIYEFDKRNANTPAEPATQAQLDARQHLTAAGILGELYR